MSALSTPTNSVSNQTTAANSSSKRTRFDNLPTSISSLRSPLAKAGAKAPDSVTEKLRTDLLKALTAVEESTTPVDLLKRSMIESGLALPYGLEGPVKELLEDFPPAYSNLKKKEDMLRSLSDENFVPGSTKFNFKLTRSDELGDSTTFKELSEKCDDAIKSMQDTIKTQIIAATELSSKAIKASLFTTVKNFATKIALAGLINLTACREASLEKLAKEIVCDVYKADREWKTFMAFDTDLNSVSFYEGQSIKAACIADNTLSEAVWTKITGKVSVGLAEIIHSSCLKYKKYLKEKDEAIRIRKATAVMSARAEASNMAEGIDVSMDVEVQDSFHDQSERIKKLEASLSALAKNSGGAKKGASGKKKTINRSNQSKKKPPAGKKKNGGRGNGANGPRRDTSTGKKKSGGGKKKSNGRKPTKKNRN